MIEKKKITEDKVDNIVLAGCSFSDTGIRFPNEPVLVKQINYDNELIDVGGLPGEAKNQHFIEIELNNQNKQHNVTLYNVARGSFGNHVITHRFKEKVNDILEQNPNAKIVGIVQLSALLRADSVQVEINTKDFPFDYENPFLKQKIYSLETFYEKHLDNIIDLKQFCDSKNIEVLVYFGWANLYSNYFSQYPNLIPKLNKVKEIVTFIEYDVHEDECANYCAGPKNVTSKYFKTIDEKEIEIYKLGADNFGGIAEYAREKLEIGYRYISWFDAHPSTASHFLWYKDIVRPFLLKTGVLNPESEFPKNVENNLKVICDVQKKRFIKWFGLEYVHEDAHATFKRYKDTWYKSMSYEIEYVLEEKVKQFSK
jgi:hypothetical protein